MMKIKKSQLQKLVTETVLKEVGPGYHDDAEKAIKMALNDDEWQQAFHAGLLNVATIAKMAVREYIRSEAFRLKQGLMNNEMLEYMEQTILDEWE